MLMLVAASLDMPADYRLVCTGHMMRGFNDVAVAAGSKAPPPLLHNTTAYPFRFPPHTQPRTPSFSPPATQVVGGQTVHNPWPIIGGVAQAIVTDSEFILPELGQAGDVRDQRAPLLPACNCLRVCFTRLSFGLMIPAPPRALASH